ncbi:WAP four-disulfide core domain protein 10A [Rousettus aegyptiacus]|uniref:WAP four-disulfide core domain 10A n=1 Tax=Rousettus aegyptiacus TaxID=9407 RepID=A0A7J8DMJ0_ROUAE|nr:WAP four-disulfide core domain protein 10A [Rousettus aegyptiacus]KAF6424216.1 WAP four-disulfide core domain 10A [Rousettus aegyptiacus]
MSAQALLPILLLCALLLQARGGYHKKEKNAQLPTEIKDCVKRVKVHMCRRHCENHQECQANNICCSAYCGNVCMSLL